MPDRIDPADASRLAEVRRFEAAGFRAWPAAAISYDGAWLVRLTAGYPAKRLNSVNPLDPGDTVKMRFQSLVSNMLNILVQFCSFDI